jgi:hypothetical protein
MSVEGGANTKLFVGSEAEVDVEVEVDVDVDNEAEVDADDVFKKDAHSLSKDSVALFILLVLSVEG